MILRANIRSDGAQLAQYLVTLKDNDAIEILEVDGREDADKLFLQQVIMEMQLNSELTKTNKAFFNVQINPAYGEDQTMTREDWYKAADILAADTGFENQRRVIVLHTKKGRTHAHVVWERYNFETGKVIPSKHFILKVDKARPKMEEDLGHKRTNYRNPQRKDLKEAVTQLWNETSTGPEFIKAARKAGYMVAAGTGNRPFMIVDENGRAFDLVRQIDGVRTKEVRARLRHEMLVTDKEAIDLMREAQNASSGKREQAKAELKPVAQDLAASFAETRDDATEERKPDKDKRKNDDIFDDFKDSGKDKTEPPPPPEKTDQQRKQEIAAQFLDNKQSGIDEPSNQQELERQKIIVEQERQRQRNRERKRSRHFSGQIPILEQIKEFFHDIAGIIRAATARNRTVQSRPR